MNKDYLICTGCQKEYPFNRVFPRCDDCNEPLEVKVCLSEKIDFKKISHSGNFVNRYHFSYPFSLPKNNLSLREGFTPLIKANLVSQQLDMKNLYFKNETVNPTWSFKDRGTFLSLQNAIRLGYDCVGTVSSGNMAVSVAAYGARAGLKTIILVSADLPEEKLIPIMIYNPILVKVEGDYSQLYHKSLKIGEELGISFLNSDIPFRIEGSKSIAFELYEQLGYKEPDYVLIPTSSGGNARGILKGFLEIYELGLIKKLPVIVCVQLEGCAPIYEAWIKKLTHIVPVNNCHAIDNAITNPFPPSGNEIIRKLKKYAGLVTTVSDQDALLGQRTLAGEGIFAQPAAAISIGAFSKLRKAGIIGKRSVCVAIITGAGLKYTSILDKHRFNTPAVTPLEGLKDLIISKIG